MNDESTEARYVERREWRVRGRVQGVAFRASARRQAQALGVGGVAENLPDGQVRVVGIGDPDALDRLAEWLRAGPPHARVDAATVVDVRSEEGGAERAGHFTTR